MDLGGHGSTSCASATTALDQIDLGTGVTFVDGGYFVTAVVPDGTGPVRLEQRSGRTTTLRVTNNTAAISIVEPPARLSWTDSAGEAHSYTYMDVTL